MIDKAKAEENLAVIRELMERPVRYTAHSGLAGIFAGVIALCGIVLDVWAWQNAWTIEEGIINCMFVWLGVLVASVFSIGLLTHIRETQQGIPHWSKLKMRMFKALILPFIAGAGLSCILVLSWFKANAVEQVVFSQGILVPAIWMLFYGIGCWQMGEFSIIEMRLMGAAFVVAGLVCAVLCQHSPYQALAITFGGFHIVYGVVTWARHGG